MREISEKNSGISECKAGFLRVKQRFLGFLPEMTKISGNSTSVVTTIPGVCVSKR